MEYKEWYTTGWSHFKQFFRGLRFSQGSEGEEARGLACLMSLR